MVTDPGQLGALLKQARRRRGMSQAELAERAGVTRQWVVAFEAGSPRAQLGVVLRALQAVGLDIDLTDTSEDPFAVVFGE